jgi:hypothetical protein
VIDSRQVIVLGEAVGQELEDMGVADGSVVVLVFVAGRGRPAAPGRLGCVAEWPDGD